MILLIYIRLDSYNRSINYCSYLSDRVRGGYALLYIHVAEHTLLRIDFAAQFGLLRCASVFYKIFDFFNNLLACIIHEDSALRVNSAKQVALSPEKRGPPRTEGDRVRCDALLTLTSNRQSVILGLDTNSLQTLQIKI